MTSAPSRRAAYGRFAGASSRREHCELVALCRTQRTVQDGYASEAFPSETAVARESKGIAHDLLRGWIQGVSTTTARRLYTCETSSGFAEDLEFSFVDLFDTDSL